MLIKERVADVKVKAPAGYTLPEHPVTSKRNMQINFYSLGAFKIKNKQEDRKGANS